jgi:hypothetical protein
LLSIPIAAAIKIVCENIETLHPISVMMGSGKTYQREFKKGIRQSKKENTAGRV